MAKRIISVSYKDDTPAFFSEEFFNDYKKGERTITTRYGQMKVSLRPEDVYCFVFWTKNPSDHFLSHVHEIKSPWYIQWTITGCGKDLEPMVPDKEEVMARFRALSEVIGPKRCIWRYDPIVMTPRYDAAYHRERFEQMAETLEGATERCVISFMDTYAKINEACRRTGMRPPTLREIEEMSAGIAQSARRHGMKVQTCAERKYDLRRFGILEGACVDAPFIEGELGIELPSSVKTPGSFRPCLCAVNTDIGTYHRCKHGCKYCYAK